MNEGSDHYFNDHFFDAYHVASEEKNMKGIIVRYWNAGEDGHGFIRSGDIFYKFRRRSCWKQIVPEVGLEVTFDPVKTEKGWRALRIRNEGDKK